VGSTISYNVELSGRPSSHVNILDALDAIDLVMQSHSTTSFVTPMPVAADATDEITAPKEQLTNNNYNTASRIDCNLSSTMGTCTGKIILPWESLAEFAFGPNWFIEGKKREEHNRKSLVSTNGSTLYPFKPFLDGSLTDEADTTTAPQSAIGNETAETSNERYKDIHGVEHPQQQCWYAPYVDVVPYYPIMQKVKRVGSIPLNLRNELHQQQQHLDISLSNRENMEEQARVAEARIDCTLRTIPDTKYWGVPPSVFESNIMNGEKEHHDDNKMGDDITPSKRPDTSQKDSRDNSKIYPFFLPPLPPAYTYKFSSSATSLEGPQLAENKQSFPVTNSSQVGTTTPAATASSGSLFHVDELLKDSTVRSSLVKFSDDGEFGNDNYYWGRRKRRKVIEDHRPLIVPKGLTTNGGGASTSSTNTALQLTIRPSSNRANRILEGSMDTS